MSSKRSVVPDEFRASWRTSAATIGWPLHRGTPVAPATWNRQCDGVRGHSLVAAKRGSGKVGARVEHVAGQFIETAAVAGVASIGIATRRGDAGVARIRAVAGAANQAFDPGVGLVVPGRLAVREDDLVVVGAGARDRRDVVGSRVGVCRARSHCRHQMAPPLQYGVLPTEVSDNIVAVLVRISRRWCCPRRVGDRGHQAGAPRVDVLNEIGDHAAVVFEFVIVAAVVAAGKVAHVETHHAHVDVVDRRDQVHDRVLHRLNAPHGGGGRRVRVPVQPLPA